ncbi:MAG TPA: sigma-70 family RNA polymerase sigma factor [Ktedonobacterales bacterium]|nr:sigma-70 family RNA polymerase sigma factor [Ktedonobacterales bacterium]
MQVGGGAGLSGRRSGESSWVGQIVMALSGWYLLWRETSPALAGRRPAVADRAQQRDSAESPEAKAGSHATDGDTRAAGQPLDNAFDAFYARHEQPLYGYLRRLSPTHEVAVELAQETFLRAWRHFDSLQAYDRPEAWLYRVATNLAFSHLRRKRPLSFSSLLGRANSEDAAPDGPMGADLIASPLDIEGQTIERDAIGRALRALPERSRAALLLVAIQGFTSEEIAEALGVTPNNARQILSRARERFRRIYEHGRRS